MKESWIELYPADDKGYKHPYNISTWKPLNGKQKDPHGIRQEFPAIKTKNLKPIINDSNPGDCTRIRRIAGSRTKVNFADNSVNLIEVFYDDSCKNRAYAWTFYDKDTRKIDTRPNNYEWKSGRATAYSPEYVVEDLGPFKPPD